jgi:hypothetical protein
MSSTPADQPPTAVERSAPEAPQTGDGDEIRFAAVGLDHSHIFGQISGLLGRAASWSESAPMTGMRRSPRRSGVGGRTRRGSTIRRSCCRTTKST